MIMHLSTNKKKLSKSEDMANFTTTYGNITLLIILICSTTVRAQTAAAPSPPGPLNVTAILEKAGQFTTLMRLMKSSQVADQINNQLNSSNSGGITLFAPTDNAFSSLPGGTLNSLTDQQKVALIQFHILPSVVTMAQFQTVSNPVRTQAGNANNGQYPLNVTAAGNQVNISTGVDNTTVSNTLYSDGQLVVYQIDKVLLPMDIFGPAVAAAPAPATAKGKKKSPAAADGPTSTPSDTADTSAAVSLNWSGSGREFALIIAMSFFWWHL